MFNPQNVNYNYLQQMQMQHDFEQRQEIAKAVKAIMQFDCYAITMVTNMKITHVQEKERTRRKYILYKEYCFNSL